MWKSVVVWIPPETVLEQECYVVQVLYLGYAARKYWKESREMKQGREGEQCILYYQESHHYQQLKYRVRDSSPALLAYQFGLLKNLITSLCITSLF